MVNRRLLNLHVVLRRISRVQIDVHVLGCKIAELWQVLSTKHVPAALYKNLLLVLVILEAGVVVAPPLHVPVVDLDLAIGLVVHYLRVGLAIDRDRWRGRELPIDC